MFFSLPKSEEINEYGTEIGAKGMPANIAPKPRRACSKSLPERMAMGLSGERRSAIRDLAMRRAPS
jgi:hypothetical protein